MAAIPDGDSLLLRIHAVVDAVSLKFPEIFQSRRVLPEALHQLLRLREKETAAFLFRSDPDAGILQVLSRVGPVLFRHFPAGQQRLEIPSVDRAALFPPGDQLLHLINQNFVVEILSVFHMSRSFLFSGRFFHCRKTIPRFFPFDKGHFHIILNSVDIFL